MTLHAAARSAWRFLLDMDARSWRAIGITVALLGAVSLVFLAGKQWLGLDGPALEAWLEGIAHTPWALPAVIALFTVGALLSLPQFLLIAVCVVAFGPWVGGLYAWIGTVVSAAMTYAVGRWAGAGALARFGGAGLGRLAEAIQRNTFFASFVVRSVPLAPFLLVNMMFGTVRASFAGFLAGCALGVIPKTALVALFGGGFMTAVAGDGVWTSLILLGAGVLWLLLMLGARAVLRRRAQARGLVADAPPSPSIISPDIPPS